MHNTICNCAGRIAKVSGGEYDASGLSTGTVGRNVHTGGGGSR
jgi:hypothetical protein